MRIPFVSMFRRNVRLAAAFLMTLPGAAVLAQDVRSKQPHWGSDDTSVLTLFAWDFAPLDDTMVTVDFSPLRRRSCTDGGGQSSFCGLTAGVHLPNGAIIEFMEFSVCDDDETENASASLFVLEDPSGAIPPVSSIVTAGSGGCLRWTSGSIGQAVDNLTSSYSVEVDLPEGSVSFRAVRLFYRLQVSPAPAFASFDDVPVGSAYHQYVEALYASGITVGCGGGNFCPNSSLTRGQMAVFLAKALGLHFPN